MPAEGETFRLLQPSLMSVDELKELISQRGVNLKSNENKTKNQLVEVYERLLMPLSQRKFPESHQGQLINKKIAEEERKKAKNDTKSSNDFQYGFKEKSAGNPLKRHINQSSSSSCDRLKPPLDSSPVKAKKICLARSSSSDKDLDKIIINNYTKRNSPSSSEGSGKEHSSNEVKQETKKIPNQKVVSSSQKECRGEDEEPKPKRMKIAWP